MKAKIIFAVLLLIVLLSNCFQGTKKQNQNTIEPENTLIGKWVRVGHSGPISFEFKDNGLVECDFGNDQTVDVIAGYELKQDSVKFIDIEGQMCQGYGYYRIFQTDYYLAFDLIEDDCGGRIQTTMGFWTKPNFNDLIATLEKEISDSPYPESYLNRARIYMALGKPKQAIKDFDNYIISDTLNARVYLNRAGTRFPDDMAGVVQDCNKAISIEPDNKNAYFLRGLARYDMGEREQGCEDFKIAIELGFSILKLAEQDKCAEFWDEE